MLGSDLNTWLQNAPAENPAATTQSTSQPANPPAPAADGMFDSIKGYLPLIAIFAIFYFVLIGPERKNRKKREEMLKQIKKGDKVMTTGGMLASVAAVADDEITLQIADGVRARFTRAAIQTVMPDEAPADAKKH
jgi:preprotein translocase subunit YajC